MASSIYQILDISLNGMLAYRISHGASFSHKFHRLNGQDSTVAILALSRMNQQLQLRVGEYRSSF